MTSICDSKLFYILIFLKFIESALVSVCVSLGCITSLGSSLYLFRLQQNQTIFCDRYTSAEASKLMWMATSERELN
jgi:hypothetical protein